MDAVTFVVGSMLKLRKGCDISSTQTQHRQGTQATVSAAVKNKNINNHNNDSEEEDKEEGGRRRRRRKKRSRIGHHPGNDIQP